MEVAIETAADGGRTGGENLRRNCPVDESYYLYFVLQQGNIFARSINLELLGRKFGDCLRAGKVFKSLACIMVGIKKNSGRIRGTKFKLPGGLVNRLFVQPIFGSNSAFFCISCVFHGRKCLPKEMISQWVFNQWKIDVVCTNQSAYRSHGMF